MRVATAIRFGEGLGNLHHDWPPEQEHQQLLILTVEPKAATMRESMPVLVLGHLGVTRLNPPETGIDNRQD